MSSSSFAHRSIVLVLPLVMMIVGVKARANVVNQIEVEAKQSASNGPIQQSDSDDTVILIGSIVLLVMVVVLLVVIAYHVWKCQHKKQAKCNKTAVKGKHSRPDLTGLVLKDLPEKTRMSTLEADQSKSLSLDELILKTVKSTETDTTQLEQHFKLLQRYRSFHPDKPTAHPQHKSNDKPDMSDNMSDNNLTTESNAESNSKSGSEKNPLNSDSEEKKKTTEKSDKSKEIDDLKPMDK